MATTLEQQHPSGMSADQPSNSPVVAKLATYLPPQTTTNIFKDLEPLSLAMCKPKLLPIKSMSLEQLQAMEAKLHKGDQR